MKYFLLTISYLISLGAYAQKDTVYTDAEGLNCNVEQARHFWVTERISAERLKTEKYTLNGFKEMSGYLTANEQELKTGDYIYYEDSGRKSSEGAYENGKLTGKWKNYRGDGETVWYINSFKNDSLDGEMTSYYKSGKLKRIAQYENGKLISGKCYAEDGKEIEYTTFTVMAAPKIDINKFLANNIRYPKECRKKAIGGRVIAKFIIDENGKVQTPQIVKNVHPLLDAELIRVLKTLPDWTPGTMDDAPAKFYFTIPVKFTPAE